MKKYDPEKEKERVKKHREYATLQFGYLSELIRDGFFKIEDIHFSYLPPCDCKISSIKIVSADGNVVIKKEQYGDYTYTQNDPPFVQKFKYIDDIIQILSRIDFFKRAKRQINKEIVNLEALRQTCELMSDIEILVLKRYSADIAKEEILNSCLGAHQKRI